MSKKRRSRNLGGLAALGGAALLAMKLAKGDRKDAAPVEDKGVGKEPKKEPRYPISDDNLGYTEAASKPAAAPAARTPAARTPAARTPAVRTPAAAPAARTPAPSAAPSAAPAAAPAAAPRVNRAEGITASGLPREARGIEPTRSAANQFFGDDMRPMAIRARQMAREGEFEPLRSGMKKGGTVKKKSGGMVSKASKRADGVAKRGKTKCKIC